MGRTIGMPLQEGPCCCRPFINVPLPPQKLIKLALSLSDQRSLKKLAKATSRCGKGVWGVRQGGNLAGLRCPILAILLRPRLNCTLLKDKRILALCGLTLNRKVQNSWELP